MLNDHTAGATDNYSDTNSDFENDGLEEERKEIVRLENAFKERQLCLEESRLERRKLYVSSNSQESVSVIIDCKGALDHIGKERNTTSYCFLPFLYYTFLVRPYFTYGG